MNIDTKKRKFLDFSASATREEISRCFATYRDYLESMRARLPSGAYSFAQAEWHYDVDDSRCPHDAWLEALEIYEERIPDNTSQRHTRIKMQLLGAYHDGYITLHHQDVSYYSLSKGPDPNPGTEAFNFHGDWLIDEVYLSDEGLVVHDIEFANSARWVIHCKDIEYVWERFES